MEKEKEGGVLPPNSLEIAFIVKCWVARRERKDIKAPRRPETSEAFFAYSNHDMETQFSLFSSLSLLLTAFGAARLLFPSPSQSRFVYWWILISYGGP